MQIDSIQIEYFLAVSKYLSFTKAAEALYVSQPAISRRISMLEEQLGVKLIKRTKRTVEMTEAGKKFQSFFKEYDIALKNLRNEFITNKAEKISYGVFQGWNFGKILNNIEDRFQREYPKVEIIGNSSTAHDLLEGLKSGKFQFAIGASNMFEGMEGIASENLTKVRRTLIFSKNNPIAKNKTPKIEDFINQNCYAYVDGLLDVHVVTSKELRKKYAMKANLKIKDNLDSVLLSLNSGNGYSFFDEYQRVMTNIEFSHIILPDKAQIVLTYLEKNPRTTLTSELIGRMIQCFRDNIW